MRVVFYELDDSGNQQPVGSLSWDGARVVADDPASPLLQNVLGGSIVAFGKRLTPADGDEFLRGLPRQYRSPYLLARMEEG